MDSKSNLLLLLKINCLLNQNIKDLLGGKHYCLRMDKYIDDMDKQIKSIKEIAKDMGEMLNIIETIPEKILDIKDLIERNSLFINSKISVGTRRFIHVG